METDMLILICSNLLFLALGFWAGRIVTNQAIPKIKTKEKTYIESDPYSEAMQEEKEERIDTI